MSPEISSPVKWVFSFNQGAESSYSDLIRAAVQSARENTTLEAHCLYDGEPTDLTRWLESQGVNVIHCRSRYYDDLVQLSQIPGQEHFLQVGSGAFLRMEIAKLAQELGWKDLFVLYTDCDVLFVSDPLPLLSSLNPYYFAGNSEGETSSLLHLNTGVMWMNLPNLRRVDERLTAFTRKHLNSIIYLAWDQGAYRVFFNPLHRVVYRWRISRSLFYGIMSRLSIKTWQWDALPLVLNWKVYWGTHADVAILHFHGPKPSHREQALAGTLPEVVQDLVCPEYEHWCELWDKVLARAKPL